MNVQYAWQIFLIKKKSCCYEQLLYVYIWIAEQFIFQMFLLYVRMLVEVWSFFLVSHKMVDRI